tara:strand:+ start:531 stop:821 length:291 start_codon:yes stop_codon:yes gene_type:complete
MIKYIKKIFKLITKSFTKNKKSLPDLTIKNAENLQSFNIGDVIEYTNPDYENSKLMGLIINKNSNTYLVKWSGFYSDTVLHTRYHIEKRSRMLLSF